jgi:uncharacterized protein YjbJ (UPF0337 family)
VANCSSWGFDGWNALDTYTHYKFVNNDESGTADTADAPILENVEAQEVPAMNRDELEGKGEQVKGKIKQGVGDLTDNERLHDEGVADEAAGEVQEGYGKAKRKVGEAINDIGDAIKK